MNRMYLTELLPPGVARLDSQEYEAACSLAEAVGKDWRISPAHQVRFVRDLRALLERTMDSSESTEV
jgi:hypothetical protein